MLSGRVLIKAITKNTLKSCARAFSNQSVTYDFKDLIIDPDQKGKDIFSLHRLEES
jgi:hypothetical protein